MKKQLLRSIAALGLACLFSFSLHAQSCTPVTKISSFQYNAFIVGDPNTLTLRAEHESIYLNGIFTVTSGALPTGLNLVGDKITGTPTSPGIYVFTIGAASAPGCPIFEKTFAFTVGYNLPCTDFVISTANFSSPPQTLRRTGSIIFRTEHFDSVTYSAVSLPPGFSLAHTPGSYQAVVSGSTQYDGPHTVTVAAHTNKGCTDTLSYTWDVYCGIFGLDSIRPSKPNLPYGIIGNSYSQSFSAGFGTSGVNIYLTTGALPPGLVFADSKITGVPTTSGIYTFELSATAFPDGCTLKKQWYSIEVVAPNTVCKSYDAIAPTPGEIAANTYFVKNNFSIMLSASIGGIVDDSAMFKVTKGTLPPGVTLNGNIVSGMTEWQGQYIFTIGAFSKDGCPYYEQQYLLNLSLEHPCDAFDVVQLWGEQGFTMVGVTMFDYIGYQGDFDSVTLGVVHLPPGFTSEQLSSSQVYISGHPLQVGYDEFVIAGVTAEGCQDTLVVAANFTCIFPQPIYPEPKNIPFLPVNEEYFTYIGFESPYLIDVNYDNFRLEITEGSLPPGLTLTDTTLVSGYIHGTPTTPGSYTFTVTAMIETCAISEQTYTFVVREPISFQSITVHAECSEDISYKKWRIHNPNNFNIPITYQPYYFYNYGPLNHIATPGDTYITLGTYNRSEPTLPYTVQIKWLNGDGTPRSILKSASTELCNPPACAYASDVVTLHQGLTKSGYNVDIDQSRSVSPLGNPDASDEYWASVQYYSLGYYGFIVLRMSGNIYNEPGDDFIVHEYSYGEPTFAKNPERAEVQISQNGTTWVSLGFTTPASCQGTLDHAFDIEGKLPWFRYVKVIDKTDRNARVLNGACSPTSVFAFDGVSDGFDLDAVTCTNGTTVARQEAMIEESSSSNLTSMLYPNPVKDWLTIELSNEKLTFDNRVELNVIDVSGNSLYRNIHALEPDGTTQLKVSELHTGMYILRIRTSAGHSGFYKFIKD